MQPITGHPVPWPEQPTFRALLDWEDGAPYPATWAVCVNWAVVDGVLAPVGIDVRSYTTHDDGILRPTTGGLQRVTARGLRDVNVAAVIERSRREIQALTSVQEALAGALSNPDNYRDPDTGEQLREPPDPGDMAQAHETAKRRRTILDRKPGPGGRPPNPPSDHLEEVARVYREAVAKGSRTPVRVVAEHFAERFPRITDPHDFRPKGWVQAARKRGLIN